MYFNSFTQVGYLNVLILSAAKVNAYNNELNTAGKTVQRKL